MKITKKMKSEFRNSLILDERSQATIEKYVRDVERFHAFTAEREITKELVIEYKMHLMSMYTPASVNSMLAPVNRFLKENGKHDLVVRAIKIQNQSFRPKEKELSKNEYFRLLEAALYENNQRLYLLMQTICSTGIRVSELPCITVDAVKTGKALVSLKGKTRMVLLPESLVRSLGKYAEQNNISSGSIFVTRGGKPMDRSNILHEMKKLCSAADVAESKVYPHNLRHLFACSYYEAEKDISRLADILGHSNINTTRIYTSTSIDKQQIKIEQLGLAVS